MIQGLPGTRFWMHLQVETLVAEHVNEMNIHGDVQVMVSMSDNLA
jgi:hypothetical protein